MKGRKREQQYGHAVDEQLEDVQDRRRDLPLEAVRALLTGNEAAHEEKENLQRDAGEHHLQGTRGERRRVRCREQESAGRDAIDDDGAANSAIQAQLSQPP